MTLPQRQRRNVSATDLFADRVLESEALVTSLRHQKSAIVEDRIDDTTFCNVLVFFGIGGIGKSELSARLERWTTRGLEQPNEWGISPFQGQVYTARWDLKDSTGSVDVLRLLISVRETLGAVKPTWPAFDLTFAAYFSSVRPGEPLPQIGGGDGGFESGLLSTLSELAQDLGSMSLVAGVASSLLRRALIQSRKEIKRRAAYRREPDLEQLLEDCLSEPSPSNQAPELAASLLWLLAREIDRMSPQERPLIAIFVDHFEYLQIAGRRDGEHTVNLFVGALPHILFVITGRDALDWHTQRRDLAHSGPTTFPQLGSGLAIDPRQHLIGTLSNPDTLKLLYRNRDRDRLNIDDDVLAQLVETTGGWPVHVEVVLTLAREMLRRSDSALTMEEIGGTFETVVRRLLDGLNSEEKRLLQATCLLPYFDSELAAATGNVDVGSAERFARRTLVAVDPTSRYPFRIHDRVRAAVRAAGAQIEGGWAPRDWSAAADRALGEAERRYEEAMSAERDVDAMAALALALNIAAAHSTWAEWLPEAIRKAPSITGLRNLIAAPETEGLHPNVRAVGTLIEALASPADESALGLLKELFTGKTPFAASAGLWKAYRLRSWGRTDDSLAVFESLLTRFPEKDFLYQRQIGVTLSMGRRFLDAQAQRQHLTPNQRIANDDADRRIHGEISPDMLQRYDGRVLRARTKESRRYSLELQTDGLILRSRMESVPLAEIQALANICDSIGHKSGLRAILRVLGYRYLRQRDKFNEILEQLDLSSGTLHPAQKAGRAELLALQALVTGDETVLEEAFHLAFSLNFRPRSWIPVEILMDYLGKPLPPVPTQWLVPYPVVRDRWLTIMTDIASRAEPPVLPGRLGG